MAERISKIISVIFHPVLIPTMGLFLMLNSGFYFSMLSWEAKRFVLLVVLFSTGILPLLGIALLMMNPKFDVSMRNHNSRVLPLVLTSIFYYLGYILLNKMNAFPEFKIYMLASILVIVVLILGSIVWKMSTHMAALGTLCGAFFALSFRSGVNPIWSILLVIIVSGLVGTARMIIGKYNIWQISAGYFTGFLIMYLVIYFV